MARDPGIRLRDIGDTVGITERAAHRIVGELAEAGYISRQRVGRRNRYAIQADRPIPDRLPREQKLGDLLNLLDQRRDNRRRGGRGSAQRAGGEDVAQRR